MYKWPWPQALSNGKGKKLNSNVAALPLIIVSLRLLPSSNYPCEPRFACKDLGLLSWDAEGRSEAVTPSSPL